MVVIRRRLVSSAIRLCPPGIILFVFLLGCVEPYSAPDVTFSDNILVVDGFLNVGSNSAVVTLSRAIDLNSTSEYPAVSDAVVSVRSENGTTYGLTETEPGKYEFTNVPLSLSEKYQLYIRTPDGKEYNSDYVELKDSPEIDSLTWKPQSDGINLYVSTHDPSGNTRYYQWLYKETWEYTSRYYSTYKLVDGQAIPRSVDEYIYQCWRTDESTKVLINSTATLSADHVSDFPLTFVERGDFKLSRLYSLLVQQRALTKEAYTFWSELRKTTEDLGGLFDPLPWQLTGNIHSADNASEPVLGYFSGGNTKEARIFIRFNDLPDYLRTIPPSYCVVDSIPLNELANYPNSTYLIGGYGMVLEGFTSTSIGCVDCRYYGGVTEKPEFWP